MPSQGGNPRFSTRIWRNAPYAKNKVLIAKCNLTADVLKVPKIVGLDRLRALDRLQAISDQGISVQGIYADVLKVPITAQKKNIKGLMTHWGLVNMLSKRSVHHKTFNNNT